MTTKWYAVKTIYRTRLLGRPKHYDGAYQPGVNIVEERIVIFKSSSFNAATRRAKVEGKQYSRQIRVNTYGQKVKTEFLAVVDCYEPFDTPVDSAEIWSACTVVSSRKSNKAVVDGFKPQSYSALISREFIEASINQELEEKIAKNWAGAIKK